MRRHLSLAAATAVLLLAGCSGSGGSSDAGTGQVPSQPTTTAAAAGGNKDCSGGLKGDELGVVRITCDGTAELKLQAGTVSRDLHGGVCHSAGDVWSAAVGVVIDETGTTGKYSGPPVDNIAVNNTNTPGKATIQAVIGGKHYFDLGNATLTLSSDSKTAHIEGTSENASDAPGTKIIVDVTC
jgi:hypothetical protein